MESFFDSNYDNNMKYLASIDFSNFDASLVTSFEKMFYGCSSLVSINFSNIVTSNVVSMKSMFEICSSLSSINLYDFNTINVFNMESMFEGCSSLLSINLSTFKTNKINNAENMFKHCSSLRILDISNFYFSKYDNDYLNMFDGINNLKYLRLYDISDTNKIISKSPLNKINDLYVCHNDNIITNLNIFNICCNFNIEEETCESDNHIVIYFNQDSYYKNGFKNDFREKIGYIVYNKKIITTNKEINVTSGSKLDIYFFERVTTMESFFDSDYDNNMKNLVSIDLSQFDSSIVSHFKKMFYGCSSLLSINFSNFKISSLAYMQSMFEGCVSLLSINLTTDKKIRLFMENICLKIVHLYV